MSDYTQTPNLHLYKPTYDADDEQWGYHLNANADTLDAAIFGLPAPPQPATAPPLMDGTAAAGTSLFYARADHVHPHDATLGIVSVTDFGAKGDGVTDDTAAIQNVLNTYAGKATVLIPNTNLPYMVNPLVPPAGTDILIYGTLKGTSASNGVLTISGVTGVTVRGTGIIDGNNTTAAAVLVNNATNVQIRDVTLQNALHWNLNVTGSTRVLVDHVSMFGGVNSPQFAQGSTDCWITNSYVNGPSGDGGFAFYGGVTNSGAIGNVFTNAFVYGCSILADAAQPTACTGITISNNIICNNGFSGLAVLSSGILRMHSHITVSNNVFYGNNTTPANGGGVTSVGCDIWLSCCQYAVISGNQMSGCQNGGYGMIVGGGPVNATTITGNDISDEGGAGSTTSVGINLAVANMNDIFISGNNIYDDQSPHTMLHAITGTCGARNAITNNHFGLFIGAALSITPASDTVVINSNAATPGINLTSGALTLAADPTTTLGAATKQYVDNHVAQPATVAPVMDGAALVGTSVLYARQDHVHPSDTSLLPLAGGTMTGQLTLANNVWLGMNDTTGARCGIVLGGDNNMVLEGTNTGGGAKFGFVWQQQSTGSQFYLYPPVNCQSTLNATALQVGGNQVAGARIAGWGTPTGGARTANFNGASATLAQTSAVVAQLILDLKTHGLLGA